MARAPAVISDLRDQLQAALGPSYTLERELGGGGMSHVFAAREAALGRTVVCKVLRADLGPGVSAERFAREIAVTARLQHAHIVPILTAGAAGSLPYYTMPFVDGLSLRTKLKRESRLSIAEAVSILRDVARALAHAHEHGVVHRDIKPENVLLSGGAAVVTDFGIAKALSAAGAASTATLTQTGMSIGTPAYMAPEQVAGEPSTDGRADLYSWGIVAYELLTGDTPFGHRPTHQLLAAHLTEQAIPVERLRPDVPRSLADVVGRCLQKNPADRPENAAEILRVLDGATSSQLPTRAVRSRGSRVAAFAAGLTLVVAGLGYLAAAGGLSRGSPAASARSIAVLPFANVGGDTAMEYFSDGLADELTGALAKIPALRVASRTSAFSFKGATSDIREIARKLNVATVLEGSVRRAGDQLRMRVQLTNAADGIVLWSETYQRRAADVFAVQEDIARSVTEALRVTAAGPANRRITPREPRSLEAHDAYLRARYLAGKYTEADTRRSIALYERAIALDSTYAPAWAGLAGLSANFTAPVPPRVSRPKVIAAARRAIALDSTLAEPRVILGGLLLNVNWDFEGARREFERALALDPNSAGALSAYGDYLATMRQLDSAIAVLRRAHGLDPLSSRQAFLVTWALMIARRYDEALAEARRALELEPNNPLLLGGLGWVLLNSGRVEEALAALQQAAPIGPLMQGWIARALALAGRTGEARRILHALEDEARRQYVDAMWIAVGYVALGDHEATFRWLAKAYEDRSVNLTQLHLMREWDPIRSDPRYVALVRKIGLPD